MGLCEDIANLLALLFIGQPAHGRLEEKDAEDGKKDDELKDNQPNQRLAPGHVAETVPV